MNTHAVRIIKAIPGVSGSFFVANSISTRTSGDWPQLAKKNAAFGNGIVVC